MAAPNTEMTPEWTTIANNCLKRAVPPMAALKMANRMPLATSVEKGIANSMLIAVDHGPLRRLLKPRIHLVVDPRSRTARRL